MIEKVNESKLADGVVLGCTAMFQFYDSLKERMQEKGIEIQLIEPSALAILELERLVKSGIKNSRLTYPKSR